MSCPRFNPRRNTSSILIFLVSMFLSSWNLSVKVTDQEPAKARCCNTAQEKIQYLLPLLEGQLQRMKAGERGVILYRIGRALRSQLPSVAPAYLERGLVEARSFEAGKDIITDATWKPKSEEDKIEALYREFLRQQELVEKKIILEFAQFDLPRARDMVALLQPSDKGSVRVKYGDEVRPIPHSTECNTYVVSTIAKMIAEKDLDEAVLFFSQQFVRLQEPMFSSALGFLQELMNKDPLKKGEQVVALLWNRAEQLLQSPNRALVIQTHLALADFLARVPQESVVSRFAALAASKTGGRFGKDFPGELKLAAAQALHQYAIACARFPTMESQSKQFKSNRDVLLQELALNIEEFEKSQLTVDVVHDPRRFAEAMRVRNQEFGDALARDLETMELMRKKDVQIETIEKAFQKSTPLKKIDLAIIVSARFHSTDPEKAEKYIKEARAIALEIVDSMSRLRIQTSLFIEAVQRCSPELSQLLANDAVKTADLILETYNPQQEKQAMYLAGFLGRFFASWSRADFLKAINGVQKISSPLLAAHLYTLILESNVPQQNTRGIP